MLVTGRANDRCLSNSELVQNHLEKKLSITAVLIIQMLPRDCLGMFVCWLVCLFTFVHCMFGAIDVPFFYRPICFQHLSLKWK